MNATMQTAKMPALGTQISAMVGCVNTCSKLDSPTEEVASTWWQARDDVFRPFGLCMGGLPKDPYEARRRLDALTPKVREGFDERIAELFRTNVSADVIKKEEIDPKSVKQARDLDIISELPANALIQSALHVSPTTTSRIFRGIAALASGAFVMNVGLQRAIVNHDLGQDVLTVPVVVPMVMGFALAVYLWVMTQVQPSISERFAEFTKGGKS